jgi:hypothetical protein
MPEPSADWYFHTARNRYNHVDFVDVDHNERAVQFDDGGAWVRAWVWVDYDEVWDVDTVCTNCGDFNDDGEGENGLCGNCADRRYAEQQGESDDNP